MTCKNYSNNGITFFMCSRNKKETTKKFKVTHLGVKKEELFSEILYADTQLEAAQKAYIRRGKTEHFAVGKSTYARVFIEASLKGNL